MIDTRPIISIFDKSDPYHDHFKNTLKQINAPLVTTWPALTELFYLLSDWGKGAVELHSIRRYANPRSRRIESSSYQRVDGKIRRPIHGFGGCIISYHCRDA